MSVPFELVIITFLCLCAVLSDGVDLVKKNRCYKRVDAELYRSTADKIVGRK